MKSKKALSILISIIYILTACTPSWGITLLSPEDPPQPFSYETVKFYLEKSPEETSEISLGQVFYDKGYTLIDHIALTLQNGSTKFYDWDSIASTTTISADGTVTISGIETSLTSIYVHPARNYDDIQYSITDIAPTMAMALGLPELPEGIGVNWLDGDVEHGVMILLDGLQYKKLIDLVKNGSLPFFRRYQENIQLGLTVYPSISTSASAALLTSAPPHVNRVYGYGDRDTKTVTLFDLAVEAGLTVTAVEGASPAFNLRNTETIISGDRDGNGFSDDNVFLNSLDVIRTGMPDILFIHFHSIDDQGHSFGPDSTEYSEAIRHVDSYLAEITKALPENSLIAILADHGMHATEEGGNHGTLTADDLIIPILFINK